MRPIGYAHIYKWSSVKVHRPVWYNSSLDSIAMERDKLFQAFNRCEKKKPELYTLAIEKRKEYNRTVKKCKQDFFKNCLILNKENCQAF